MAKKLKDGVRVLRIGIGDVEGGKETLAVWHELTEIQRDMVNTIHNMWIACHEQARSFHALKAWYKATLAWHKADKKERGAKPKCPVKCRAEGFDNHVYHELTARFPEINNTVISSTCQAVLGNLETRKAERGSLPGWMAILLGHQALPSSTDPLPVFVGNKEQRVLKSLEEHDGEWSLVLRIDRIDRGTKAATSTATKVQLRTRSRGAGTVRATLERLACGEYSLRTSSIQYRQSDRRWYFLLCYRLPKPEQAAVDPAKVAHLDCCEDHPLLLAAGSEETWLVGRAAAVPAVRRKLKRQRIERQNGYRVAGSSNKGHGRQRALGPIDKLSTRWKDFSKRLNEEATRRAVDWCLERGIGTIVYHQPQGAARDGLYLYEAGADRDQNKGWDFYQLGHRLAQKGDAVGIAVKVEGYERAEAEAVA